MPRGLSELQKKVLNILEDHEGYTNRGFLRYKIWPSIYPKMFKTWDMFHSAQSERSRQKRNAAITLHKSLKGLEKRGQVKLYSIYPYSVTSPEFEIHVTSSKTKRL